MRFLIGAMTAGLLALAFAGCPEQNVDPDKYPDAWWIPGADAAEPGPDAEPAGPDAAAPEDAAAPGPDADLFDAGT